MNKLVKKGLGYFSTDIIINLLALATLLIITNNTKLDVFGFFVLIQTTVYLTESIFNFQGWQALVKFCVKPFSNSQLERTNVLLSRALSLDVFGSVLCSVIHLPVLYILISINSSSFDSQLYIASIFFGVAYYWKFSNVVTGFFRLAQQYQLINLRSLVVTLTRISLVAIALFYNKITVLNLLWVFAFSEFIGTLVSVIYYVKKANSFRLNSFLLVSFRFSRIKSFYFKYCFYCWWSSLFSTVIKQIDIMVVGLLINNESAGVLRVIKQISRVVSLITNPINVMLFPEFSRLISQKNHNVLFSKLNSIQIKIFFLLFLLYLPFYYFSDSIIGVFGKHFTSGNTELSYYMFAIILGVSFSLYHPLLMSLNKVRELAFINTVNSLVYAALMVLGVYYLELLGYVLSYLVFMVLSIVARLYIFNRERFIYASTK